MRKSKKQIKYEDLLHIIESTDDQSLREQAIYGLVTRGGADGARVLIEIFPLLMWRETKFQIIEALSSVDDFRITEFLINISRNEIDLPLAREACFSLGKSQSLSGHMYLINIAKNMGHPLYREALFSLSNTFLHSDFNFLPKILQTHSAENLSAQMPSIISALGASGNSKNFHFIKDFLTVNTHEHCPELVFAAIIAAGKIGSLEALSSLDKLAKIHDIIIRDLVEIAKNRIHYRQKIDGVDLLKSFCLGKNNAQQQSILSTLRELRSNTLWNHFLKLSLANEIEPNKEALVRIAFFDAQHAKDDLKFMLSKCQHIKIAEIVTLTRLHGQEDPSFVNNFFMKIPDKFMDSLAPLLFTQDLFDKFLDNLSGNGDKPSGDIDIINTLVSWRHIEALSVGNIQKLQTELIKHAQNTPLEATKERAIRAMGQLKYSDHHFIDFVRKTLNKRPNHPNNLYLALKQLSSPDATKLLVDELIIAAMEKKDPSQIKDILWYLSQLEDGSITNADFLSNLSLENLHSSAEPVLKILTLATWVNSCEFIEYYLTSKDYSFKLLAVAAAKNNMSPPIAEVLFDYVTRENFAIAERSLDSLSKSHKKYAHQVLLKVLDHKAIDKRRKLKILRAIEPEPNKNYSEFGQTISKSIQHEEDEDILDAFVNFRDRININNKPLTNERNLKLLNIEANDNDIDLDLVASFPSYMSFPETTQSALRNTETVFKYPKIFHNRVDKSTILVEYVKAIDILLHTHLGPVLFYSDNQNNLTKMQSRIYLFGFDNPRQLPKNPARILQCEEYFPQNKFPMFKLSQICQDILTGRICNQQFQTVDGLRAWALILLMFFRQIEVNHRRIEPLMKLPGISPRQICFIAAKMNELQSLRNDAAHRGMMLEISDLIAIREKSFFLIKDIVKICQKSFEGVSEKIRKAG